MTRELRHDTLVLLLALILTVGLCQAVDVGEAEGSSSSSCPNVTTISIYGSSSNSSSKVQVADASACTSSVVNVATNSAGVRTLDLRRRGIAAIASLPMVNTVRLDSNKLRAFTTSATILELYMSNNSIPSVDEFKFPIALTILDLANNAIADIASAELPSSVQYLNLSGNPIGSLSNVSLPSSLLRLDVTDASIATLENLSFPSSITTLNFSDNPITLIRGVIFPDSLTELVLVANAATTLTVVTSDKARVLQTNADDSTALTVSVLEEFEVRQSDADRFEKLTLWDVATTSTLSCSDSNANPRYVQDTMLCVLSDSEFADKYESVVIAASSGSTSGSMWGADSSSSQKMDRNALKETLGQRRSWFLIGAVALLLTFTVLLFVNGLCLCLRRKVRGGSNGKDSQSILTKAASTRTNDSWHESSRMEPDDEVRHLLSSDTPITTNGNLVQPEPEAGVEAGDTTTKKTQSTDPIVHLQQELLRSEIEASLVTCHELLAGDDGLAESFSRFSYFKAVFHQKTVVLKTLSTAANGELRGFVEEIRLSCTLSHPQIVVFYGFIKITRVPESLALVMEYMPKGDLNTFIQSQKRFLQKKQAERIRSASKAAETNSLDSHRSWREDSHIGLISDNESDDEILQSDDEIDPLMDRDDPSRWNWWSSSAVYKSKLSIANEVARAVQYLHSFSPPLFHGNLSSRKVFLNDNWNVKLGDLTCCSALRRWSSSHKQSEVSSRPSAIESVTSSSGRSNNSSHTAGDEIHMDMTVWTAPEVLDGRQYTQKADIYSFGVLLSQLATYECTSAEHSVMDDTEVPMLNNVDNLPVDGKAPTPIRLLMFRCQAFQPEIRPTADELIQELRQIEHELMEKLRHER